MAGTLSGARATGGRSRPIDPVRWGADHSTTAGALSGSTASLSATDHPALRRHPGATLVEDHALLIGQQTAYRLPGLPADAHELRLKLPDLLDDRASGPCVGLGPGGERLQPRALLPKLVLNRERSLGGFEADLADSFALLLGQRGDPEVLHATAGARTISVT